MLITEDQAKLRWCPHARQLYRTQWSNDGKVTAAECASSNRMGESLHTQCVGSQCMAWRWFVQTTSPSGIQLMPHMHERDGRGYCGLSGPIMDQHTEEKP